MFWRIGKICRESHFNTLKDGCYFMYKLFCWSSRLVFSCCTVASAFRFAVEIMLADPNQCTCLSSIDFSIVQHFTKSISSQRLNSFLGSTGVLEPLWLPGNGSSDLLCVSVYLRWWQTLSVHAAKPLHLGLERRADRYDLCGGIQVVMLKHTCIE